jgi:radical SAM superfamily enzyme YgiQ (UPF0313 family)
MQTRRAIRAHAAASVHSGSDPSRRHPGLTTVPRTFYSVTHSEPVNMRARTATDVLFAMPPGGASPRFSEHLGAAFLRTMLHRAGIRSRPYLPARNPSLRGFARFLDEARPAIVGFTAYETNLHACRAMAGVVHDVLPDTVVMVGGPNATFSPEETLDLVLADVSVRGAAEGTITSLAASVVGAGGRARRDLAEMAGAIPNLVLRRPGGMERTRAGDLSSFPGEYFRTLDDIPSPYAAGLVETPEVGILTARGCNQHCTYCSFAAISGRRIHYHGVERVLDDIAAFKAVVDRAGRRPSTILLLDDAFTLAPARARAICEGIVARGLQLPFECETRADRVDLELMRLMKRAGFVAVTFGLESAVPRVLRTIGKVQHPASRDDPGFEAERAFVDRVRRAVAGAKQAGLTPLVSVMGGLPGESREDFRETLAFVRSLDVDRYAHNVLSLLPGTPLYRDRARHGLHAGRDAATRAWRTTHAYAASTVAPLGNSNGHAEAWQEANEISDALCGIPRQDAADDAAAWAVVLHRDRPDGRVASWLREVLAIHGVIVVVGARSGGAPAEAPWAETLAAADASLGTLAVLSRASGAGNRVVLRSARMIADHRFELLPRWRPCRHVAADDTGRCAVRLWIASRAAAPPPKIREDALFARTPQIADGCRWWSGGRRCAHPRVLHVWADDAVTPCWGGPAIGSVGDPFASLLARARSLPDDYRRRSPPARDRCPLGTDRRRVARGDAYELASQMQWLLFSNPMPSHEPPARGGPR